MVSREQQIERGRQHMALRGQAVRRAALEKKLRAAFEEAQRRLPDGRPDDIFTLARAIWRDQFRALARQRHRTQPQVHPVVERVDEMKEVAAERLAETSKEVADGISIDATCPRG